MIISTLNLLENCLCQLRKPDGKCFFQNVRSTLRESSHTALHLAAFEGNHECISILVEHGANIEERDKDGQTPLVLAAGKNHCIAVSELILFGANKYAVNDSLHNNIDECMKGGV